MKIFVAVRRELWTTMVELPLKRSTHFSLELFPWTLIHG